MKVVCVCVFFFVCACVFFCVCACVCAIIVSVLKWSRDADLESRTYTALDSLIQQMCQDYSWSHQLRVVAAEDDFPDVK